MVGSRILAGIYLLFLSHFSVSCLTLVLFPCFILVAMWLARRPWLAAGWLVVSLVLQVLLLEYWVHFGFVA